jgi:hypothetical protein
MKNIMILLAAALLCACADASAQDPAPVDTFDISAAEAALKKRIKFGRRIAVNNSQVTNMRVRLYSHDGESFSYKEYRNQASFGFGFEVAGVIILKFTDALALNFPPAVIVRKPLNTSVVGISEIAVAFPMLLEWRPFEAKSFLPDVNIPLRAYCGIQAGVPVYARIKWNNEGSAPFNERTAVDFGLAVGAGADVSDKAFIDAKVIFGVSGYDRVAGHRLNQVCAGVNYVR